MEKSYQKLKQKELQDFLDEKARLYEHPKFIETDPIQIPHRFDLKEDQEIAGFLTATIAWGNRKSIIKNATKMMEMMGNAPYDFIMSYKSQDLQQLGGFVHRTFNAYDFKIFIRGLRNIYENHNGLEDVFVNYSSKYSLQIAIHHFKHVFFEIDHMPRTEKHISDPLKNSAAKRINMFLRWMVRPNDKGVDLGLWETILPSQLSCPLDVHSGRVARQLGLLSRKQNDHKALIELDQSLRQLDPNDPVKYDYALFGIGVFENGIF